jgi:hypothetical protein
MVSAPLCSTWNNASFVPMVGGCNAHAKQVGMLCASIAYLARSVLHMQASCQILLFSPKISNARTMPVFWHAKCMRGSLARLMQGMQAACQVYRARYARKLCAQIVHVLGGGTQIVRADYAQWWGCKSRAKWNSLALNVPKGTLGG